MAENLERMQRQVKDNIADMITNNNLAMAAALLQEYMKIEEDAEAFSMQAVIAIQEGRLDDAKEILNQGLKFDGENFDLQYNLAYVYEVEKEYTAAINLCRQLCEGQYTNEQKEIVRQSLTRLGIHQVPTRKKDSVFVKPGLDSFLGEILQGLADEYETRKIIVNTPQQIDKGMEWADICWFEWCDELISYASQLDVCKEKRIFCRLHSYEAFTENINKVKWENVDTIIFVAEHIRQYVLEQVKSLKVEQTIVIPNGIQLDKYTFNERNRGFNIAYVGYINYKKGPMLLLHTFKAIYDLDSRYKLYLAGTFQDGRDVLYFKQMITEMGIEHNVNYTGWQDNLDAWLEDKNYILCTSILESQNISVMQAMSKGIKPLIHNFVGAREIYPVNYVWNTIDECLALISNNEYSSKEYRSFIANHYSLAQQISMTKSVLEESKEKNRLNTLAVSAETEDSQLGITQQYLQQNNEIFIPYDVSDVDNYNFKNGYRILIGKKEIIGPSLFLIEFIIENSEKKKLLFLNIWYDIVHKKLTLPAYLTSKKNYNHIQKLIKKVVNTNITTYSNNVGGFVFDEVLKQDIEENETVYIWERGIPASKFMPAMGFLRIIERYKFAGSQIEQKDMILEAPSGFGYGAAYLAKLCQEVYSIDIAQDNIDFAMSAYSMQNIKWQTADVTKLPYDNGFFDKYVSFEVLEHLPLDLIDQYFSEAIRVLKSGGKMIISTPNREMRKHVNNPFHLKEYSFSEFDSYLKKYFAQIEYYSVVQEKVEQGFKENAINMIAVCVTQ